MATTKIYGIKVFKFNNNMVEISYVETFMYSKLSDACRSLRCTQSCFDGTISSDGEEDMSISYTRDGFDYIEQIYSFELYK